MKDEGPWTPATHPTGCFPTLGCVWIPADSSFKDKAPAPSPLNLFPEGQWGGDCLSPGSVNPMQPLSAKWK